MTVSRLMLLRLLKKPSLMSLSALKEPKSEIGSQNHDRALGNKNDLHRTEDETQADRGDSVHAAKENAVHEDLQENAGRRKKGHNLSDHAEVSLLEVRIHQEIRAFSAQSYLSGLQHVGKVGHLQSLVDVLLNQEDADPFPMQSFNDFEHQPHHHGG